MFLIQYWDETKREGVQENQWPEVLTALASQVASPCSSSCYALLPRAAGWARSRLATTLGSPVLNVSCLSFILCIQKKWKSWQRRFLSPQIWALPWAVAVSAMLTPVNYMVWPGSRGPTINGFPEPHLQELSMCYAKCILSGAVS